MIAKKVVKGSSREAEELMRRRRQTKGSLRKVGNWWRLQYREDVRGEDGQIKRVRPSVIIGPCRGPGAMTQKQAQRVAWDTVLSQLDTFTRCPQSIMTVAQFVEQKFEPEYVWTLKHSGRLHYKYCLSKILPQLGRTQLRSLNAGEISTFLRKFIESGKSVQTANHLKNALSAIIEYAKQVGYFTGENPARLVRLPAAQPSTRSVLTFEQGTALLQALESPLREMALLAMTSSLNVAELCGLRWKRVNLTPTFSLESGEPIPPYSVAVRENFYRGQFGTTKTGRRNRNVPLAETLVEALASLKARSKFTGPEHLVFASRAGEPRPKTGLQTPIDPHNVNARQFAKVGTALGVNIGWHSLRHCAATFSEVIGMARSDRQALMGHANASITDLYTHSDVERMRTSVNEICKRLMPAQRATGSIQ